jgi:TolA-binding protein
MTGYIRTSLASHLLRRGKYAEAEVELNKSLEIYEKTLPPDHQYIASSEHLLGELLLSTNRLKDAETVLFAAMNRWARSSASPWRSARSASALGEVLYRLGRTRDAERYLLDSYRVLAAESGADRDSRSKARERITRFYTDQGQQAKLEELLGPGGRSVHAQNESARGR